MRRNVSSNDLEVERKASKKAEKGKYFRRIFLRISIRDERIFFGTKFNDKWKGWVLSALNDIFSRRLIFKR